MMTYYWTFWSASVSGSLNYMWKVCVGTVSDGIYGLRTRPAGLGMHSPEVCWPVKVSHIHLLRDLSQTTPG